MKTQEQVKAKLAEIENDERLHYPPADVFSNALLALIQVDLEAKRAMLKWLLEDEQKE